MAKKVVILGSTGSIGTQALAVLEELKGEYEAYALAAGRNVKLLAEQIQKFRPQYISVATSSARESLRKLIISPGPEILTGSEGLVQLAALEGVDLVLIAVNGIHGLEPALAALEKGNRIALANKETLVAGGPLVMKKAREKGIAILPVDSEHSAVLQCLETHNKGSIEKIILTASGGPFWAYRKDEMDKITPAMALKHPNWRMGTKITIDSASLINKGLEVIEAHWLFDMPYEKIEVVIHRESIVHSMVAYEDGVVMAQLGRPDMRVPIQYAFTYPRRTGNTFPRLDLAQIGNLTFEPPDTERFPGLKLAYEAGKTGGTMPVVFNAANEQAVELFIRGAIGFNAIPDLIGKVMSRHRTANELTLAEIAAADSWARQEVISIIRKQ